MDSGDGDGIFLLTRPSRRRPLAMDANTAVEGSSPTATSPTPSPDGVPVNVAENSTTVGGTVANQTKHGSQSTSRTSTATLFDTRPYKIRPMVTEGSI
ncbi:hypothetical protein CRV24_006442 [Beauveria bassiana]|nr:hypothetical protein CRV24_006442 [Beauveria bassiana]KAH8713428.1 hypothetical protein HC256_006587 [Beauveria bassiana]